MKIFNFPYENVGKTGKNDFNCFLISYLISKISVCSKTCNWHQKVPHYTGNVGKILVTLKTLKYVCKVKKKDKSKK